MVAFNKKTEGGKQVSTHLSPRGNRTNSGQVHSAWVGVSAPLSAPTSLTNVPALTSVAISFTAPTNDGGSPITNYEYSFNNSTWTAFSPVDTTSPVTISDLSNGTAYTVYLRAVNIVGSGPASSGTSFTTLQPAPTSVEYLVIAGGGGGGGNGGGGGGAGGFRQTVLVTNNGGTINDFGTGGGGAGESRLSVTPGVSYTVTVGGGGTAGGTGTKGGAGSSSIFATITSTGGGGGAGGNLTTVADSGGSGGGGSGSLSAASETGGARVTNPIQGFAGGSISGNTAYTYGAGGGGAGAVGSNGFDGYGLGSGGNGKISYIDGNGVTRGGGGGGAGTADFAYIKGDAGTGGGGSGAQTGNGFTAQSYKGGGGGGGTPGNPGGAGGSGTVIIAYPSSYLPITTISAGLNYAVSIKNRLGSTTDDRVYEFISGTGTITF